MSELSETASVVTEKVAEVAEVVAVVVEKSPMVSDAAMGMLAFIVGLFIYASLNETSR